MSSNSHPTESGDGPTVSRRGLLAGLGGGALLGGATLSGGAAFASAGLVDSEAVAGSVSAQSRDATLLGASRVDCYGVHQAGITTSLQGHTQFVAFDIAPDISKAQLQALMQSWSSAIEAMTQGRPPEDEKSQEIYAYGPASLTATVSFGPGFFDREGLKELKPDGLNSLPPFHHDQLKKEWTGGDLFVQVCSDDPVVTSHSARTLSQMAAPLATIRWSQTGFTRAAGTTKASGLTHRNLMGQLDGSGNPKQGDPDFDSVVWTSSQAAPWAVGGSFVVVRKIRMILDHWDQHSREEQEDHIGRTKDTGAPLTGKYEFDEPDFSAQRADGRLTIPADAHVRLTHHTSTNGAKILRRGYSYDDGYRSDGANDSGLLFIAWQADPRKGFLPIQARMDVGDALNHMTVPEGSALGFAPPGFKPGGYLGDTLFES